jgi:hypothetical protein
LGSKVHFLDKRLDELVPAEWKGHAQWTRVHAVCLLWQNRSLCMQESIWFTVNLVKELLIKVTIEKLIILSTVVFLHAKPVLIWWGEAYS